MIYVNGASWAQRSNIDPDYSWPAVLQSRAKCPVINQAAGCGSNSRILNSLNRLYQTGSRPSIMLIALCIDTRWHLPSRGGSTWSIGGGTVTNDRFFKPYYAKEDELLVFFAGDVYDVLEYTYQQYSTIWQIQELADNYFKCPVIFFNQYSNKDYKFADIHNEIYKDPRAYVLSRVEDKDDYSTQDYIKSFEFFKKNYKKWHIELDSWSDLVYNHMDDEKGLHPYHPSPEGHKIICDSVQDAIKQKHPKLYKELI